MVPARLENTVDACLTSAFKGRKKDENQLEAILAPFLLQEKAALSSRAKGSSARECPCERGLGDMLILAGQKERHVLPSMD